jgi:hypothetical protein
MKKGKKKKKICPLSSNYNTMLNEWDLSGQAVFPPLLFLVRRKFKNDAYLSIMVRTIHGFSYF